MVGNDTSRNNQARWEAIGDELLIRNNGEMIPVSANEIYGLVFEKKILSASHIKLEDIANNDEFQFSRFPVAPFLAISNGPDLGIRCDCQIENGTTSVSVENFIYRKADHILINKTWSPFYPESLKDLQSIIGSAGIQRTEKIRLKEYLALKAVALKTDSIRDITNSQSIFQELETHPKHDTPPLFNGKLYPYQLNGWKWLSSLCEEGIGCILADEMGLGKTIQLITLLSSVERASFSPSLIIAPSTILENWRREIRKFSPALKTLVHQGHLRTGLPEILKEYDVVITSYDTVVGDGSLFGMVDWQLVILDEAQNIKNPETKRAKSIKRLKRRVGIAVTGTPVENRLRDLWSILDFCIPSYLGKEKDFITRFEKNETGAASLEPFVTPLMLRRRVAEVATDLPSKIEIPQILSLSHSETQKYEQIRLQIVEQYGDRANLVALNKLRMFCAHPCLVAVPEDKQEITDFAKFMRLLEIAEEVYSNNEKIIVFTSYNEMIEKITYEMGKRYGVYANHINGETPIIDRQKIVDEFSAVSGGSILALNPRAAGVGLNITAANHVVHYNLEWNPAIEDQASARAHRRGQSKPVTIHRLFIADTVEELVNERLERKRNLSETAVVGVQGQEDDLVDIMAAIRISPMSAK